VHLPQTTTAITNCDPSRHRLFAWSAFLTALVAYPLLLSHYSRANSPTFDEGMHITGCWIAWFGARKPSVAGLPCRMLAGPGYVEAGDTELPPIVPEKFSGTIFVSDTLVDYDIYPYLYFAKREPDDVIAGSVLVYRGDFDVPEIAAERRAARGWWFLNHRQANEAVEEFAAAVPHALGKGGIHSLSAWALLAAGPPARSTQNVRTSRRRLRRQTRGRIRPTIIFVLSEARDRLIPYAHTRVFSHRLLQTVYRYCE
jgi:hypothetical protein